RGFVDAVGGKRPGPDLPRHGAHGVGQLGTAAVVQAEIDDALAVVFRQVHHIVHGIQDPRLQPFPAAAEKDLAAALVHLFGNSADMAGEVVHQVGDLFGVPGEVFGGKDVQRKDLHATVCDGVAGDLFQAVEAGLVPQAGGHHTVAGPAAVAVHND